MTGASRTPKKNPKPAPGSKSRKHLPGWTDELVRQREYMAQHRAAARDLAIPACAHPEEREACRYNLPLFKERYFNPRCPLPTAPFQIERLERIQHLMLYGGQVAQAEPRSSAKTTDAQIATVWGLLYGHHRFVLFGRETGPKAVELIGNIKTWLEKSEELLADFPELCVCVRALEGSALRCRTQTVNGVRTRIQWSKNFIQFPEVQGFDGSGAKIIAIGFDTSTRGQNRDDDRPTFVFLDDIETRESVNSETLSAKLETGVLKDVMGLAGPGQKISVLWAGTIIKRGCLIDRYTDIMYHPEWSGRRYGAITEWPTNRALWDQYLEIRRDGFKPKDDGAGGTKVDLIGRAATEFYLDNREAMDAGAVVIWPDNYVSALGDDGIQLEYSNLQYLHNMIGQMGLPAFMSEYQNDPLPEENEQDGITPFLVQSRLSGYPEYVVPSDAKFLVRFIDIGTRELYYTIAAFHADGTSHIVEYAAVETRAPVGDHSDPNAPIRKAIEQRVLATLRDIRDFERAGTYRLGDAPDDDHTVDATKMVDDGDPVELSEEDRVTYRNVDLTLVDAGWMTDVVAMFVRESGPRFRMTFGRSNSPGAKRFAVPKIKDGVAARKHYYAMRQEHHRNMPAWFIDADFYKLHTHERFAQDPSTPGACSLYGNEPRQHGRYASHICAETYDMEKQQWKKLSKHNHYLDCTAGCHAAADMLGVSILGESRPSLARRPEPATSKDRQRLTTPDGRPFSVLSR